MKKTIVFIFALALFNTACTSKVQTYDSSVQKNEAAQAHKDLNNELKK